MNYAMWADASREAFVLKSLSTLENDIAKVRHKLAGRAGQSGPDSNPPVATTQISGEFVSQTPSSALPIRRAAPDGSMDVDPPPGLLPEQLTAVLNMRLANGTLGAYNAGNPPGFAAGLCATDTRCVASLIYLARHTFAALFNASDKPPSHFAPSELDIIIRSLPMPGGPAFLCVRSGIAEMLTLAQQTGRAVTLKDILDAFLPAKCRMQLLLRALKAAMRTIYLNPERLVTQIDLEDFLKRMPDTEQGIRDEFLALVKQRAEVMHSIATMANAIGTRGMPVTDLEPAPVPGVTQPERAAAPRARSRQAEAALPAQGKLASAPAAPPLKSAVAPASAPAPAPAPPPKGKAGGRGRGSGGRGQQPQ